MPFYKKKYSPIKIGDIISINIDDLSLSSSSLIDVACDLCNKLIKVKYKAYNRQLKNNRLFTCSKKCSSYRLKSKLMEEYGVNNISQRSDVKEKIKNTNLDKYGNEYFFGSDVGKDE